MHARAGNEVALSITLLGGFDVRTPDGSKLSFPTRKAQALLAVLASRPGQSFARDKLCAMLWSSVREVQARHSLRQTLLTLRRVLPNVSPPLLRSHSRALALDAARVRVDVVQFYDQLQLGSAVALHAAAALYQGDLLDGVSIDEPPFTRWCNAERARVRADIERGLSRLIELSTNVGRVAAAIDACRKLLQLDPLREETHRRLMALYARAGLRSAALRQYQVLEQALRSELGATPDEQTQRLRAELEAHVTAAMEPVQG